MILKRVTRPWIARQALETMMQLLFTLILAHLFADFPLQSNALARLKKYHLTGVLLHVAIYMAVTALLLENLLVYWPLVAGLGAVHFLIDGAKMRFAQGKDGPLAFLIDQSLHLVSMVAAAYLAQQLWTPAPQGILPCNWLHLVLLAACIPAAMVYFWVWTDSSGRVHLHHSRWLRWIHQRVLLVEQRFGLVLVGVVIWLLARQEGWQWGALVWW